MRNSVIINHLKEMNNNVYSSKDDIEGIVLLIFAFVCCVYHEELISFFSGILKHFVG